MSREWYIPPIFQGIFGKIKIFVIISYASFPE